MNLTAPLLAITAKLLSGATVRWHECQPDTCQRVYFANHTSHLDALVLWSSLPGEIRDLTRPVAAKDYWSQGAIRPLHRQAASTRILIDREEIKVHQSPVDLMIREIGYTHSLIVFPEGGRNPGEEMQEFKSGLYYLSKKRPDLELMPVYIDNLNRVLPRGEFLPVPLLELHHGRPADLAGAEGEQGRFSQARPRRRAAAEGRLTAMPHAHILSPIPAAARPARAEYPPRSADEHPAGLGAGDLAGRPISSAGLSAGSRKARPTRRWCARSTCACGPGG